MPRRPSRWRNWSSERGRSCWLQHCAMPRPLPRRSTGYGPNWRESCNGPPRQLCSASAHT